MPCTKNNIISIHLKQTYCYPKRIWQHEHVNHYGTLYMTTGGNMPYSQSVGVRCNVEDVKLISGSIQWLTRSQCGVWHFIMSFTRRSTEGILDFVSEQTKHTGIHWLCYEEYCSVRLSWNTDARQQSFSASTQPSQTRHDRPKITDFMGEKQTPLNPPDRATTISRLITMERTIARYNNKLCIANQYPQSIVCSRECGREKMNVADDVRL